jgi:hypothetical protein
VAFAMSLPLGLGMDAATNLLPFGELFFFAGFGFYIGLGLFALSLMRLGIAARASAHLLLPIEASAKDAMHKNRTSGRLAESSTGRRCRATCFPA